MPPPPTVDQHALPGPDAGGSLQRDRSRLGESRGLGERQGLRLVGERRFRRYRVLGEASHQTEVVAIHLIARPKTCYAGADGFDPSGDIGAERPAPGGAQPTILACPGIPRSPSQSERLIDVAATLTSTCFAPGDGIGTSSMRSTSGGPYRS